tara:strand:- start:742 stop:1224 length:483 start_codon:yes stop_codon:yes gene_type:complete
MNVIFLDFDGVLNVIPQGHDDFGGIFHTEFVENLSRIIDETRAKLVISSSWRHMGIERLRMMWEYRGYPGEIIGITPDLYRHIDIEVDRKMVRGDEIQSILDRQPEIINYVILDDDTDMLKSQRMNFVQTSANINHPDCIDIGYGLTKECTNRAIRILNR